MNEDDILKIVRAQEDQIRWQRVETSYFWDWQGNLLLVKTGEPSRIAFTTEEVALVQGAISTHNHPHGLMYSPSDPRRIGHSFSASDVQMACLAALSILRIVTPKVRYMMKPPAQGWDEHYWANVIEPEYRRSYT